MGFNYWHCWGLLVRSTECKRLDDADVAVVANDPRKTHLVDLLQLSLKRSIRRKQRGCQNINSLFLTWSEGGVSGKIIVEKAIGPSEIVELFFKDARERRTKQTTRNGMFCHSSDEKVHFMYRVVHPAQIGDHLHPNRFVTTTQRLSEWLTHIIRMSWRQVAKAGGSKTVRWGEIGVTPIKGVRLEAVIPSALQIEGYQIESQRSSSSPISSDNRTKLFF